MLLLDGALAAAEPKTLCYRLLHVAARLTRGGRRLRLRIDRDWPWKRALLDAFTRLAAFPMSITLKTANRPHDRKPGDPDHHVGHFRTPRPATPAEDHKQQKWIILNPLAKDAG
jgi:hypothetical protein